MGHTPPVPGTIWITGLPAAGKTTLGAALETGLRVRGYACTLLDGEALRARLGQRYGHSLSERYAVLREIVDVAVSERNKGLVPIVATISHKRDMRAFARQSLGRMLEVFLDCPSSVCSLRDGKGHYKRAADGEYDCFVGVTEQYERWDKADLTLDTAQTSVAAATEILIAAALKFLDAASTPDAASLTR
jgi:adenylylsulfate kinase-like enzyme